MNKIELVEHTQRFFCRYELYKNGIKIDNFNRFIKIDDNFITEYEAIGCQDSIIKGEIIKRVSISNCEFNHTLCID